MHKIEINDNSLRTDLILEQNLNITSSKESEENGIKITNTECNGNKYTTIFYEDITDKTSYINLKKVLVKQLKELIKIKENDLILVVGLGNEKSTPDSLGPKTIENIIVTRYLKSYTELEKNYSNVAIYKPNVYGNTGIESIDVIEGITKKIKPTIIIAIDALKANSLDRLNKTIQITDSGIHPGSGIFNNRGEISKETFNCEVFAIGIPTVVDIETIIKKYSKNNKSLEDNFIVTPTNIDFLIEKQSSLLGESLNSLFHNLPSTNK